MGGQEALQQVEELRITHVLVSSRGWCGGGERGARDGRGASRGAKPS